MSADVVADPVDLSHGVIKLPDTPGLGATIDPKALARYRRPRR
jgi:L-alanine-DL-glutamate epimerase-like enolase superfamily enzyme